jgi:hypothetical protein
VVTWDKSAKVSDNLISGGTNGCTEEGGAKGRRDAAVWARGR